jgi:hypothetical protein
MALLGAASAPAVDTEILYDGLGTQDWSTCREQARLEREFSVSEVGLQADPPALRWRFVSRSSPFNDLFLLRPIERRFDSVRVLVQNQGAPLRLAAKVRDADGAEWTVEGTDLATGSAWQWVDFPMPAWHVASWSSDANGRLDFPLASFTLIAFGVSVGPEYCLNVQRLEILRPERPLATLLEARIPATLRAGETFAVTLAFSLDRPVQEDGAQLVFRRGTAVVARLPLPLPRALTSVQPGEIVRVDKAVLSLSQYAWGGAHEVRVQLGEARAQRSGQSAEEVFLVNVKARKSGHTVAAVKDHGGTPTLFINGRPHAGMAWATYHPTLEVFSDFARAGVDLFTFSATPTEAGYGLSKTVWTAPDTFDYSQFDERVAMALQACPNGYIFPRLYLHAPAWWSAQHPDDIVLMDLGDGKPVPFIHSGGKPAPSWASATWRADTIAALQRLIEHVEAAPYADRIIGYHLASGTTEEWMMWGGNENEWVDYSPANLAGFRQWLRGTYRTEAALQAAWSNPTATFAGAAIPTKARRQECARGALRDPASEQDSIDFYLYNSDLVAETIGVFAHAVKQMTHRDKIVGVFYGYLLQLCGEQRQQNGGHLALGRVLACPDVDFLCSPTSYAFRQLGGEGTCHFMSLFDSTKLRGKLWFDENDVRTSISGGKPGEWGRPTAIAGDLIQQNKELANCIANGAAQWWFDVGSNVYSHPDLMGRIKDLTRCANAALDSDRSPVDEVAFVVDERSLCRLRVADPLGGWLLLGQIPALQRLGAPVGHYLPDDLPRLQDRKLFIFPTSIAPTAADRRAIDALKGNGRVLVFLWGAGAYRDGRLDEQGLADLTGIRLRSAPEPAVLTTTLQPGPALTDGLGGLTYGPPDKVSPCFYAADPDAVVLGTLADGRPGLVVKQYPDWTAVYSAAPLLPAALLRRLAKQAGVHLYIDSEDVVWATRDLLAVSAREPGPRTLHLPREATITDVYSGQSVPTSQRSFEAVFADRETKLWRLR